LEEPPLPAAIRSVGNDTYSVTREAKTAFNRDTDKLKDDASAAAQKFCDAQGKQMRILSLTSKVPTFGRLRLAKIVFKALPAATRVSRIRYQRRARRSC